MNNLTAEAEQYFQELDQNKDAAKAACLYINNTLDEALNSQNNDKQDISFLLSLIPYIESGDGTLAYKYIGETHRILRVLHIIQMEQKYQMPLFCSDCTDKASLMEKYMLVLFALRRILFHLSETSVRDAIFYLQQNLISPFAVYVITQDDLIQPDQSIYQKIIEIYFDNWSSRENQLFLSLIQSF